MMGSTINICLFVALVSATFASIPFSHDSKEEMISLFGKSFYKHGKPTLPQDATPAMIFKQCMDHLNSSGCNQKWDQRYWVRGDYYVTGGPIFFQFGGEGPGDALIDNYYWHTYAKQHSAMLVVLEHRFYGESFPSEEDSLEVLKLLTSQQALADAAYFIDEFSSSRGLNDSKWVAFGGSYAGNLAAWMKQKYPQHVKAAVASSGPLLALYDFPGYMETVSEVVKAVDQQCFNRVYDAFQCMESLVNGSTCGNYTKPSEIIPALKQCYSVDFGDMLDRESFFNSIAMGYWANNWPSAGVRKNCAIVNSLDASDMIGLYGNFLVEVGSGGNCKVKSKMSQHNQEVMDFIHSKEGRMAGAAGWFWQTCYEFGYYMSADPKHGLFGYNTFSGLPYGAQCWEFGAHFSRAYVEERIKLTNEFYKAKDIDSKCVIFVNGGWDPWHTLGINSESETSSDNAVVHIPGAEHCDDMLPPKTEEMQRAQDQIEDLIGVYLNDPRC